MLDLPTFTVQTGYGILLILCRIGSMYMLMPALGELYISQHIRMAFALLISYALYPLLIDKIPPLPQATSGLSFLVMVEILIGLFFGMVIRMLLSAAHIAGLIIATVSGLAAASLFDSNQGGQTSIFGNLLSMISILLLVLGNAHHLVIQGLFQSYQFFVPGSMPSLHDMTYTIISIVTFVFLIGMKIAAPHLIVSFILNIGGGLLARLMPTIQIFFILIPVQIYISIFVLIATISSCMIWYHHHIISTLQETFQYP